MLRLKSINQRVSFVEQNTTTSPVHHRWEDIVSGENITSSFFSHLSLLYGGIGWMGWVGMGAFLFGGGVECFAFVYFFSFMIGMGENEMIIDLCLFSLCDMKFI